MDLSPETLRQVEFREQWRGYSQDEVDDFLERVAVAVAALQDQLAEAVDRAGQAERRLLETSAPEDELRRTLVLAQRTADAARQEAEEEAARVLAESRAEAERLVREAESRARRAEEDARSALRAEVESLAAAREALQADVEELRRHVDAQRDRLRAEAERLLRDLEPGGPLSTPGSPSVSAVEVPEPAVAPAPTGEADEADEAVARGEEVASEAEGAVDIAPEAEAADENDDDDAPDAADASAGVPAAFAEAEPDVDLSGGDDEDDADDGDSGDETGEIRLDELANGHHPDDDPFLAELRRAVTDTEPLGPRDEAYAEEEGRRDEGVELYDQDLSPSSRFRLRRRR